MNEGVTLSHPHCNMLDYCFPNRKRWMVIIRRFQHHELYHKSFVSNFWGKAQS